MRRVISNMVATLDGYSEGLNGEFDWPVVDEEHWKLGNELQSRVDTVLFGRVTYQIFENYWPSAATNPSSTKDEIAFSRWIEKTPKIVFSKTLQKVGWKNTRLIKHHVKEEILKMKQQSGKDMLIYGSPTFVSSLMNMGLIDEYLILVEPVVLGRGKPLFKDLNDRHSLKLLKTKTFDSGVVVLHYQPIKKESK